MITLAALDVSIMLAEKAREENMGVTGSIRIVVYKQVNRGS
jgi:hypothetical protein